MTETMTVTGWPNRVEVEPLRYQELLAAERAFARQQTLLRALEAEMRQLAEAKFGSLRMQREWDRAHTYELQWANRLAALLTERSSS